MGTGCLEGTYGPQVEVSDGGMIGVLKGGILLIDCEIAA